jgi:Zn-dependent protease
MASLLSVPPGTKVGILTSGGLAPCLSAAVGFLIEKVRTSLLLNIFNLSPISDILARWPTPELACTVIPTFH